MIGTVIVSAIIALLAGFLGTLIALKIHYRYLQRTQAQHSAWENAQESRQRNWEMKQERRALDMETKLIAGIQQVESDWNTWKQKNAELAQAVSQQHAEIATFLHIERELARIPLVEEMPIAFDSKGQRLPLSSRWQPLALARVDLSERDLSRRFLGQANLREARLRGANLFMADLSGADLSGADLTGADLTGANLSHADLHNAILVNANLQVADMHNTILFGANLHGARNLSPQQLDTAIYDATSQLDADTDLTLPRLPRMNKAVLPSTTGAQAPSSHPSFSDIPETPIVRAKQKANDAASKGEFIETPDLDVSPTPTKTRAASPTPVSFETDGVIEGEITEISEAVTVETAAVSASQVSEPTDAEIREISDSDVYETGEAETSSINRADSSAASDTAGAASKTTLNESTDSQPLLAGIEESEIPDIASPPLPTSEAAVAEPEPPLSESEPSTPEGQLSLSESEPYIAGSEPSMPEGETMLAESEPSIVESEPSFSEGELPLTMPARAADGVAEEASAEAVTPEPELIALDVASETLSEAAPTEPALVALEIDHDTNGNGHEHNNGNGNGTGNGYKRNTSAGSVAQKGKNSSRKRSRRQ